MQREPPRRAGSAIGSSPSFDAKLQKEEEVLDALVQSLARGQLDPQAWTRLHQAAARDDRVSELAFAYESYGQGRRLKTFQAAVQAEFLFKGATFLADVLGDELGARTYLERAIVAMPTHVGAFERLDQLLTKAGEHKKLAEAYVAVAQHRPRGEHVDLLRKAASLVEKGEGGEERSIEIHQQLLRLDPGDPKARAALEEKYLRANRHRDVARLLEHALAAEAAPPSPEEARAMRSRLIELYGAQLHEPERTMPHVEALLAIDPTNDEARKAAAKLIAIKGLAARAAAALADAHAAVGTASDVARYLAIELEHTRGPKRREVLTRLGVLRQDRLNDPAGAFEAFEQALLLDPSEDDLRVRYVTSSLKLGRPLDAARTLSRVGSVAKDARVRARISAETGELLAAGGDVRRARATFVSVLAAPAADSVAVLKAARALSEIYANEKDSRALADVLEKIANAENEPEKKRRALERLGELASHTLNDVARAVATWRRLVDGPSRGRALAELESLYEGANAATDLAWVLEERANDSQGFDARALLVRAAEVVTRAGDGERASAAWKRIVDKFGASRDVNAQWIPLLEARREWTDLAVALAADAQLAPESERAAIWARLGHVHLLRTKQVESAIDAFKRALAIHPAEKTSRAALEKLLASHEHGLAAAGVLEPIHRAEDARGNALLHVLDVRAQLDPDGGARLAALAEAADIAAQATGGLAGAIELAARGLGEAISQEAPIGSWLARMDALAAGIDAKRLASLLSKAMGDRAVTSPELSALARRAGEAHAASGDATAAIGAFRRALDFEPNSTELLARIDELLRDQGNAAERVALYRATLARGGVAPQRRRELLHAIGALARDELHDAGTAIESYRSALEADPDDRDAHAALVDLFTAKSAWDELGELLDARIARATGTEAITVRAQLAELAATHGQVDRARAHAVALLAQPGLPMPALDVVERVAEEIDDVELARAVLERRVAESEDAREQVQWLTRLGILDQERTGDVETAIAAWKRAAALARSSGDDGMARDLYERVREVSPLDRDATQRLAELLESAEDWNGLPELYDVLARTASDAGEQVAVLLRHARLRAERLDDARGAASTAERAFVLAPHDRDALAAYERYAIEAHETATFARMVEATIKEGAGEEAKTAPMRSEMWLARARALASDPSARADAVLAYRTLLGNDALEEAQARSCATALESLLVAAGTSADAADWRWLLEWRFANATDGERVSTLLASAAIEETRLGDPARALVLHRAVLTIDPDNVEALTAAARIALATGDASGSVDALLARRDRSEGTARSALDLEIATILLDHGLRRHDALRSIESVLESAPGDRSALALSARLLAHDETREAAVAMLERTLDSVDDGELRAQVLQRLLDTPSDASAGDLRRRWFERLLDLQHDRSAVEEALATCIRAAEEMPTIDSFWERAEALARSITRPDEVAALYARVLASNLSHEDALALGRRAVAFHEEWFEDSDRVVHILERVLEIDPSEAWAFDRLKLLFDAAERWDDLFALCDRAIAAASGARRVELLEDAAQIAKDFANRSERAIGYLEQLNALRPNDAGLSASLERLYERHGRSRELVQLLHARVPRLAPREAQATRARVTSILLNELGDAASALAVVEEIIARGDEEDAGLDVAALLERILAIAPPNAEVRDSIVPPADDRPSRASVAPPSGAKRTLVRHRAAALLKERYASAGREADLVRVLEIELETIRSVKERIRRHVQIADLHSSLGRDADALEHAVSLVLLEPDVVPHRERLAALAARVNRYDRLAEVLVTAADDCTDDALRIDLLMHAGVVQADALEDDARAIDLFFRVLDVRGFDAAHLASARRLAPLLERAERPYERLDTLERIAALEPDAGARESVLRTIASLAGALGESDRAIAAWQRRLGDDPNDFEALEGLVALFQKERRWRPLIEVLERRASLAAGGEAQRPDRVRAAEILRCELGAIDEAIGAWTAIEAEFGPTDESTRALAALLRAAERWKELGTVLERAVAKATGVARADLACELGDVRRGPLRDAAGAIAAYAEALAINPRQASARAGLHAIVVDGSGRSGAIDALLATYRAEGDWRAVLGLLEPRLSVADDVNARVDVLREAATLAESRAGDREAAFAHLRRALLHDPSREDLPNDLRRLAEATHTWRALADAYREALDASDASAAPAPWSIRLRMALGDVLAGRLDDPRGALYCYARVLAEAPTNDAAARAAIREASRVARWDAIAKVLVDSGVARGEMDASLVEVVEASLGGASAWDGATSALATTLAERALSIPARVARDLEARIGVWHRDRRADPDDAEQAFARALGHAPDDPEILAALASLQRRTKGRPLVDSLLRLAGATGGDLDLLREAAEVARASVGDRGLARSIVERVLKLAIEQWAPVSEDAATISSGPTAAPAAYVEWALAELTRIHEEEGDLARIVELLVDAARLPFARERSRSMRHDAAVFALERVGNIDGAVAIWRALVEEDRDDAMAVARLIDVLERNGRRAELLAVRREQVDTGSGAMRVVARLEAARLEATLGDHNAAIASLRANLEEDTRHEASVKELVALLEADSRHAELETLLARQAQREEDADEPRAAADLWARAAEVAESQLGDTDGAIANHRRVIALEPRARSLDALARLLAARELWSEAAAHLAALLDQCEAAERARVTLCLAEALAAAGDEDAARARLEEQAARDPSADEVVSRLRDIYRSRKEWSALAELLTRSAGHARDKAARLAALREAAALYRGECKAPSSAIPLLEQASDLDPDDRDLRLALADALGAAERFGDARSVLRALVDGFGGRRPKERAPVHYQLARLDLAMGDRAQALVELDTATRIDAANPEILRALAELARDDAQLERAERSYRALLAVLRRNEDPGADTPIVRSEVLVELAAIARGTNASDRAEELIESALEIATKNAVEARRLEQALLLKGEHATLARALEARIARGGEPDAIAEALSELASVLDEPLQRPDDALAARMRAIELAPYLPALHAPAVSLARRCGVLRAYADRLVALGADAEAREDDDLACDLALRVGALFEHDLGDDAEAARHYERAQRYHLRLPDVLRALDRIYERLGDVTNQARVLAKRIDIESMSSAAGVTTDALYRLARIKLVDPKALEEGCDLLESALRVAPDFARAESVLEAAADAHPQSERLVALYERVGREPGHERALVRALTLRAELPGSGTEPLREAIVIARSLGDVSLAESLLRKLVPRAGDDPAALTWALTTLGELREAAGDVADAVALKRQAAELADGDDARRLHFEVARLAKERLHDLALAMRVYQELHAREPVDRDAWEPLLDVYRLTGEHAQRAELIAHVVEFVDDPVERSRLRLERAKLVMNELGGSDEAAPMFREIVDDDPAQVEAAILLAGILERSGREEDLAELLSRQIDGAKDRGDAQSVAELSLRLGALVERRDVIDARTVYYAALEWAPNNPDVLRALVRLLASDDDALNRADAMEKLLGLEDTDRVVELASTLADLRAKLADEDGVRRALEAGFRARPTSANLRDRLEKTYASSGEWANVASLYEAEAGAMASKPERVARLREAATVWREMANDPKRAADALRRARGETPEDATLLSELVELLASSNDKAGATLELTLAIDWLGDDSSATAPLLVTRAKLRDELGDEDGALFDLEHAFRVGGAAYAKNVVDHLERLVSSALEAGDSSRWRASRLRLAEILPLAGDADRARALLAELLKHDAKDRDALRALARLEERAESWDAASSTYRRLVALEDSENVVETALRLANACERANRLGDARGGLERARMVAPAHEALTTRLLGLYETTGAFRELAALHLEEAKGARDVAGRFTHLLRAGTLMLEHGADPNAALVPLREANALRPGDLACSARLAEGLAAIGKTQEAMDLLGALLAPHKGRRSRELALVHLALAHVARAGGNKKVEIASLTTALDMDPQNGTVASELALVAREASQWELAQRALRAVTMLKSPAPLSRGLAYQYLGEIAQKQGDLKRAVMLLKRAVDDDPSLASARELLLQLKAAE